MSLARPTHSRRARAAGIVAAAAMLSAVAVSAASQSVSASSGPSYRVNNLVADRAGVAAVTDSNLVNPWGLAAGPATPLWVADNGTDKASVYGGGVDGSPVSILPVAPAIAKAAPTGQVFNSTSGFVVSDGTMSAPALFIFSSESGTISGWSPTVGGGVETRVGARVAGASYKGLAMATTGDGTFLYAPDFHNARIDVFDSKFGRVKTNGFVDPALPDHFAPFNVQLLNGRLYVAYAMQDADAVDEVAGPGLGFVDVYSTSGHLVRRLVSHGALNAPWGLAIAPDHFGQLAGALLVGNFGDGRVNAYNAQTGQFLTTLSDRNGMPLSIDGLWALRVGNGYFGGTDEVVFSAGSDDEAHGLLGTIHANN